MFFSKSPSLKSRLLSIKRADCYNHQIQKSKSAEEIPKVRGSLKSQRIPPIFVTHDRHCNFLKLFHHWNWGGRAREEASKSLRFFLYPTCITYYLFWWDFFSWLGKKFIKYCCVVLNNSFTLNICWPNTAKNVGSPQELVYLKKMAHPALAMQNFWKTCDS